MIGFAMDFLFEKCIEVIFRLEGGYSDIREDNGGETNYGISKRFFPEIDIKNLTKEMAKHIYYSKYWVPMELWGIDNKTAVLQIFDFGINVGRSRAIKIAQDLVEAKVDGIVGKETTRLINEAEGFVNRYKRARIAYYNMLVEGNKDYKIFKKGWLNRVERCKFA